VFIYELAKALEKEKIPYALVGGHAVALHGALRGTIDIDLVVAWRLKTLEKLEQVFHQLGLESRLPIHAKDVFTFRDEYIQNRNLIAWNFYDPKDLTRVVDVIINYDLRGKGVDVIKTQKVPLKILSKKDLIEMKRAANRRQDIEDIKALEKL